MSSPCIASKLHALVNEPESDDEPKYNKISVKSDERSDTQESNTEYPSSDKTSKIYDKLSLETSKSSTILDNLPSDTKSEAQESDVKQPGMISPKTSKNKGSDAEKSQTEVPVSDSLSTALDNLPQDTSRSTTIQDKLPTETSQSTTILDNLPSETSEKSEASETDDSISLKPFVAESTTISDNLPSETSKSTTINAGKFGGKSDEASDEESEAEKSNTEYPVSEKSSTIHDNLPSDTYEIVSPKPSKTAVSDTEKSTTEEPASDDPSTVLDNLPTDTSKSTTIQDQLPTDTSKSTTILYKLPSETITNAEKSDKETNVASETEKFNTVEPASEQPSTVQDKLPSETSQNTTILDNLPSRTSEKSEASETQDSISLKPVLAVGAAALGVGALGAELSKNEESDSEESDHQTNVKSESETEPDTQASDEQIQTSKTEKSEPEISEEIKIEPSILEKPDSEKPKLKIPEPIVKLEILPKYEVESGVEKVSIDINRLSGNGDRTYPWKLFDGETQVNTGISEFKTTENTNTTLVDISKLDLVQNLSKNYRFEVYDSESKILASSMIEITQEPEFVKILGSGIEVMNGREKQVEVVIEKSGSKGVCEVVLNVGNGTAKMGEHFKGGKQTVKFEVGETRKTVVIPMLIDEDEKDDDYPIHFFVEIADVEAEIVSAAPETDPNSKIKITVLPEEVEIKCSELELHANVDKTQIKRVRFQKSKGKVTKEYKWRLPEVNREGDCVLNQELKTPDAEIPLDGILAKNVLKKTFDLQLLDKKTKKVVAATQLTLEQNADKIKLLAKEVVVINGEDSAVEISVAKIGVKSGAACDIVLDGSIIGILEFEPTDNVQVFRYKLDTDLVERIEDYPRLLSVKLGKVKGDLVDHVETENVVTIKVSPSVTKLRVEPVFERTFGTKELKIDVERVSGVGNKKYQVELLDGEKIIHKNCIEFSKDEKSISVVVDLISAKIGDSPEKTFDCVIKTDQKTLATTKVKLTQPFETIQFTKTNFSVTNGQEKTVELSLQKSGSIGACAVSVRIIQGSGTAEENVNFVSENLLVHFEPLVTMKTVTVKMLVDENEVDDSYPLHFYTEIEKVESELVKKSIENQSVKIEIKPETVEISCEKETHAHVDKTPEITIGFQRNCGKGVKKYTWQLKDEEKVLKTGDCEFSLQKSTPQVEVLLAGVLGRTELKKSFDLCLLDKNGGVVATSKLFLEQDSDKVQLQAENNASSDIPVPYYAEEIMVTNGVDQFIEIELQKTGSKCRAECKIEIITPDSELKSNLDVQAINSEIHVLQPADKNAVVDKRIKPYHFYRQIQIPLLTDLSENGSYPRSFDIKLVSAEGDLVEMIDSSVKVTISPKPVKLSVTPLHEVKFGAESMIADVIRESGHGKRVYPWKLVDSNNKEFVICSGDVCFSENCDKSEISLALKELDILDQLSKDYEFLVDFENEQIKSVIRVSQPSEIVTFQDTEKIVTNGKEPSVELVLTKSGNRGSANVTISTISKTASSGEHFKEFKEVVYFDETDVSKIIKIEMLVDEDETDDVYPVEFLVKIDQTESAKNSDLIKPTDKNQSVKISILPENVSISSEDHYAHVDKTQKIKVQFERNSGKGTRDYEWKLLQKPESKGVFQGISGICKFSNSEEHPTAEIMVNNVLGEIVLKEDFILELWDKESSIKLSESIVTLEQECDHVGLVPASFIVTNGKEKCVGMKLTKTGMKSGVVEVFLKMSEISKNGDVKTFPEIKADFDGDDTSQFLEIQVPVDEVQDLTKFPRQFEVEISKVNGDFVDFTNENKADITVLASDIVLKVQPLYRQEIGNQKFMLDVVKLSGMGEREFCWKVWDSDSIQILDSGFKINSVDQKYSILADLSKADIEEDLERTYKFQIFDGEKLSISSELQIFQKPENISILDTEKEVTNGVEKSVSVQINKSGTRGACVVTYKIHQYKGTAKSGENFKEVEQKISFEKTDTVKTIQVDMLVDEDESDDNYPVRFFVELLKVEGKMVDLSEKKYSMITVNPSEVRITVDPEFIVNIEEHDG